MINVGDTAPDFELPDQTGTGVSLDQLVASGDFILYFYPADFTPVCTAEACAFRDNYQGMARVGLRIVGVSPQSVDSHRRFVERYEIPFPLLSDSDSTVIRDYGVSALFGFGVRRATFLIDSGKVVQSRVVSDFFVGSHLDLINRTIAAREP
jgi:peroxiredoxin Q/BCP